MTPADRVRRRGGLGLLAMAIAAVALQRASTAPWGTAEESATGAHYVISAVGLSRTEPGRPLPTDCRWWPRYGDATLCATTSGAARAATQLRRGYPLLQVALWLSVASLLLQALRVPRQRLLQAAPPAIVAALASAAFLAITSGAPASLRALAGTVPHFTGIGALLALAGIGAALVGCVVVLTTFSPRADG